MYKSVFKSYFVFSMLIILLCFIGNTVQAAPFECFGVSDLVRIFEDGYNCPKPQKSLEIFGIRNEHVSTQCVIKANQDLQNVTVSLSPLKHVDLSTSKIVWMYANYEEVVVFKRGFKLDRSFSSLIGDYRTVQIEKAGKAFD